MKKLFFAMIVVGLLAGDAYAAAPGFQGFVGEYQASSNCDSGVVHDLGINKLTVSSTDGQTLIFNFGDENGTKDSISFNSSGAVEANGPAGVSSSSVDFEGNSLTAQGDTMQRVCACGECDTYVDPFQISATMSGDTLTWNSSFQSVPGSCAFVRINQ